MKLSEKQKKKIWIAVCVMAAGCILMAAGYLAGGRSGVYIDGEGTHTAEGIVKTKNGVKREKVEQSSVYRQEKLSLEAFAAFDIKVVNADVSILPSDSFYLEYSLNGKREVSYSVENGVFSLEESPTEESLHDTNGGTFVMWGFGPGWSSPEGNPDYYLKLYVPSDVLLKEGRLEMEYGDLYVEEVGMERLEASLFSGNMQLEGWGGRRADIDLHFGDLCAGVKKGGSISALCSGGNAKAELWVEGSLREYAFVFSAQEGNVKYPEKSLKGCALEKTDGGRTVFLESGAPDAGRLEIWCEHGDIRVKEK